MAFDRSRCVPGAARLEPARRTEPGREEPLIGVQHHESGARAEARAMTCNQTRVAFALCARRHRIPFVSRSESPAAPDRPITTTSIPLRSFRREWRNHSRTRRFTRLRTTAPPTFRLTVIPSRCGDPLPAGVRGETSSTKAGSATRCPSRPTLLNSLGLSNRSPRRNGPVGSGMRLLG